jgi:hypothetical protein
VQVTLVPDERVESLVRAMVDHFAAWGGLPLLAVFDRLKTIALKWTREGHVTEWNPTFAGVALDLRLGVELCWPYSRAEGLGRESRRLGEGVVLQAAALRRRRGPRAAARRVARQRQHAPCFARDRIVPAVRLAEERPRLRALRVAPVDLALRVPMQVGPTGYVLHETRTYSMPPESIGIPGTLYLYRDKVHIVAGRYESLHDRLFAPKATSTLPEHRAERVAAVSGKRAQRYTKREHLVGLGSAALAYLTEPVHRRPRVWIRDVDRLHELLDRHGDASTSAAPGSTQVVRISGIRESEFPESTIA